MASRLKIPNWSLAQILSRNLKKRYCRDLFPKDNKYSRIAFNHLLSSYYVSNRDFDTEKLKVVLEKTLRERRYLTINESYDLDDLSGDCYLVATLQDLRGVRRRINRLFERYPDLKLLLEMDSEPEAVSLIPWRVKHLVVSNILGSSRELALTIGGGLLKTYRFPTYPGLRKLIFYPTEVFSRRLTSQD